MNYSKHMNELIQVVARDVSLPEEKSAAAVTATLRYLMARLPSPTAGRLHELLEAELNGCRNDTDTSS